MNGYYLILMIIKKKINLDKLFDLNSKDQISNQIIFYLKIRIMIF